MPDRLERVLVDSGRGVLAITWAEREALLERVDYELARRFRAVGASRPVELSGDERAKLLAVLQHWGGEMPNGLRELRDAIASNLAY